jgi:membrane fusion protein (multidrug efflux system)
MLRKIILVSVLSSIAILFSGCKKEQPQQQMPPPIVIITEVVVENVNHTENFIGNMEAANRATINARVGGFLERRLVQEGDYVVQDQILFTIEKTQYIAALRQANANAENARQQLQRGRALLNSASISRAQFDNLVAADAVAEAALSTARLNLTYTDVRSPIAGKVGLINFNIGETVGPASGPLTTVIAPEPMFALFSITDRQIQRLRTEYNLSNEMSFGQALMNGADLQIIMSDGSVYPHIGRINFTDNMIDRSTNSLRVRGEFPNPHGQLTQGQTVTVRLRAKDAVEQVVIPQVAVINDVGGRFVLAVDEHSNAVRIDIELGERLEGGRQVVRSGLKGGEKIIIEGMQRVRPNTPVTAMTREQQQQMIMQQQQQGAAGGR